MIIRKQFRSAFVVEKSKLTRLLAVIKDSLHHEGGFYRESFEARLAGAKGLATNDIQHILELDNSERSRVEGLTIQCEAGLEPHVPAHEVTVTFDGREPVDIGIRVSSDDQRLASDVMSVAEEQVERMLERGLAYRVFKLRDPITMATFAAILGAFTAVVVGIFSQGDKEMITTMWLTPADLAYVSPLVDSTNTISSQQATEILTRQLKNVIAQQTKSSSPLAFLTEWRLIVVILPAAIAVVALFALVSCYPQAVFLWGDAEEWYRKMLARRGLIWNVVLATLFLGIIANLAVFALGSLISGTRSL
jgi:hypothetical protein